MSSRPLFVVIEGIDCSGKTSLVSFLKQKILDNPEIKNRYKDILFTFEPGGLNLPFDKKIRELLLYGEHDISRTTAALLFFASQSENLRKAIIPLIRKNGLVICDRFSLSTLVYQGCFGKIDFEFLYLLTQHISEKIDPDIIFNLNISEETHQKRLLEKQKAKQTNTYDLTHKYSEMILAYEKSIKFLKDHKQNIVDLDGHKSFEENSKIIIDTILNFK